MSFVAISARRAAGLSLREFTKVVDATAILASRGLKPAAQGRYTVALKPIATHIARRIHRRASPRYACSVSWITMAAPCPPPMQAEAHP